MINWNIGLSDVLTTIILLVGLFNAWQNQNTKLEIARLKLWIMRNFQTKPDSILKEYEGD